jgi:hypothetical protein
MSADSAGEAMPVRRWWEELPDELHRRSNATELKKYRKRVALAAAMDVALRSTASAAAAASLAPLLFSSDLMAEELESWTEYQRLVDEGRAAEMFPRPQPDVEIVEERRWFSLRTGVPRHLLSFQSPYSPANTERAKEFAGYRPNQRAYAQYWTHKSGPRPTLIAIHGFMADRYWFNTCLLSLRSFYDGYDILLYTLPFHGYRAGFPTPFSGYSLLGHGVAHFNEGMAQAIYELRVFMDWLQKRGVPHIGVTGLSLGGYTSALLAAADERLAFCIPRPACGRTGRCRRRCRSCAADRPSSRRSSPRPAPCRPGRGPRPSPPAR